MYGNEQQGRFLTKYPEVEPTYYGVDIPTEIKNGIFSRHLGKKAYELKDHLGNVRTTFSDIKMPKVPFNGTYEVDLLSKSEYYPYGMKINDLSYNATGARYWYNGTHEQDLEVNADGNYLDFGNFRYDSRVAMRRNQEPLRANYPNLSGYSTYGGNPIMYTDLDGNIFFAPAIVFGIKAGVAYFAVAKSAELIPSIREIRQTGFAMQHPIKSVRIEQIAKVVSNFTVNVVNAAHLTTLYKTKNDKGDIIFTDDGTEGNAFRHVLGQALITKDQGKDIAERIGYAHEDNTNTSMLFSSLPEADKVADLQNNKIGREIGEKFKNHSNRYIAKEVANEFNFNGLYTVEKFNTLDSKTMFRLVKSKITDQQLNESLKELDKKNENGLDIRK